jgi:hypothetical protein
MDEKKNVKAPYQQILNNKGWNIQLTSFLFFKQHGRTSNIETPKLHLEP